jgi:hypothetical protein
MAKKEEVINKYGRRIRMNEAVRKIAERHFGINKPKPEIKNIPAELLKLPKRIDITKAIETIEIPKVTPAKVEPVTVVKEEPVKATVKAPVAKKKRPAYKAKK